MILHFPALLANFVPLTRNYQSRLLLHRIRLLYLSRDLHQGRFHFHTYMLVSKKEADLVSHHLQASSLLCFHQQQNF